MTYLVATKPTDGTKRARTFQGIQDALDYARTTPGLVRIEYLDSREFRIFRDGVELNGEEGQAALLEFDENRPGDDA
jgi:hypothetical protein